MRGEGDTRLRRTVDFRHPSDTFYPSLFIERQRRLLTIHSSDISITTTVTRRRHDASLGNIVATLNRRRISLLMRSTTLLVRRRFRRCSSNENTVKPSGSAVSAQLASLGALCLKSAINICNNRSASARSGAVNIVRMRLAIVRFNYYLLRQWGIVFHYISPERKRKVPFFTGFPSFNH